MLKLPGAGHVHVPALLVARLTDVSVDIGGSQLRDFLSVDGGMVLISQVHDFNDVDLQLFDRLFKIFFRNTP